LSHDRRQILNELRDIDLRLRQQIQERGVLGIGSGRIIQFAQASCECVNKSWKLFDSEIVQHSQVQHRVVAQLGKFRQRPWTVVLKRLLDHGDAEARLIDKPMQFRMLARGNSLCLIKCLRWDLRNRFQPGAGFSSAFAQAYLLAGKDARFRQNTKTIQQTIDQHGLHQGLPQTVNATLLQGPQRCHQISIVDGGNETQA
jgi:hypothetical protein